MPLYEYRCRACRHSFQKLVRSAATQAPAACPKCNAADAERLLSQFAYHQSLKMQLESLDPRYEKEAAWAESSHLADDPMNRVNLNFDQEA